MSTPMSTEPVQDTRVDPRNGLQDSDEHDDFPSLVPHPEKIPSSRSEKSSFCGFFSKENMKVAVVPLICGVINGYAIGFVGVYSQLNSMSTNCALYQTEEGCVTVPFADCAWQTGTSSSGESFHYCGWQQFTCRAAYPNSAWPAGGDTTTAEAGCLSDDRCTWSYSAKACQNPFGYSASYTGIFAGALIAGNMFGSLAGGRFVTKIGARLTFLLAGLFSVVASVMCHVATSEDTFWVLTVGRFVIGICMGLVTVACPVYVHENANPLYRRKLGFFFQVWGTLGPVLAAAVGLGEGQTMPFKKSEDGHVMARMQGIVAVQTFLSLLLILLGAFVPETKVKSGKHVVGGINENEYTIWQMRRPLFVGAVMVGTLRFTGFNALLNFGPQILGALGMAPLVGNFIFLLVNFVGTLISIPLDSFFSLRHVFLFGSCFVSCMCLCLCGIPVYPGVAKSLSVTNGCAITGIMLFIFVFEVCVGPPFYVLTQEIFPPSFRRRGNSLVQPLQFVFNFIINVCYNIAVENFSGGPQGNQHKGQAIVFIFFGGFGLICFVLQLFFLRTWEETQGAGLEGSLNSGLEALPDAEEHELDAVAKEDQEEETD